MPQARILILFAHPRFEKSVTNAALLRAVRGLEFVTVHDLYECYPDFDILVEEEKQLLLDHDIIIWHHPFYWYSSPPLLKQWIDLVLAYGWAYGKEGTALKNKLVFNAITTGGTRAAYQPEGHNRFTVRELLTPFNQTAHLCNMIYLPPFVVYGTHHLHSEELEKQAVSYKDILEGLSSGKIGLAELKSIDYLNEYSLKNA